MAEKKVIEMTDDAEDADISSLVDAQSMRVYEIGYHIIPTVKEDALEPIVSVIRATIEKYNGSFIAEGTPALMRLAYPMDHRENDKNVEYDRAFFGWIKFEAMPAVTQALDEALKAQTDILRYMVFRTVREDIRRQIKAPVLREVRRTDVIKQSPHRAEESTEPISEAQIDKAIEELTVE
jgi:ribosomal protein S6